MFLVLVVGKFDVGLYVVFYLMFDCVLSILVLL